MNDNDEDKDLRQLRAWMSGDREMGAQLCDRYFDLTYRFFRSKVCSTTTHDLVQNTFEALIKSGHRFQGRGPFRSFLLGISLKVLNRHFRTQRRDRLVFDGDEFSCADMGLHAYSLVEMGHDRQLLVMALRSIPVNDQIVIELKYWEGMTSREIGQALGLSSATIRCRWVRARSRVKKALRRLEMDRKGAKRTMTGLDTWAEEIRRCFSPSLGAWMEARTPSGVSS